MAKNMPDNWQPPAPAWAGIWDDTRSPLVVGYFGIQADHPGPLKDWAETAFSGQDSPLKVDCGTFVDVKGVINCVYIAYWKQNAYQKWWHDTGLAWWASEDRFQQGHGVWREITVIAHDHFETLNSSTQPHGASEIADSLIGPIEEHGYNGAMRDRIKVSAANKLSRSVDMQAPITITPQLSCLIRSGQNWSMCNPEQKDYYTQQVQPVLQRGMNYLQNNPLETRCYSMRYLAMKDEAWQDIEQSCGVGFGVDIYAFEDWAKSHPTHLAILDRFMGMVENYGENLQLMLWHEVVVIGTEDSECEYIGCHEQTGFLPYT